MKQKKQKINSGFVLLYAILVSGVILSVGLSLGSILFKQVLLASVSRSSQFAYYAADSGRECVGFWNERRAFSEGSTINEITCGDSGSSMTTLRNQGDRFRIQFLGQFETTESCAEIEIITNDLVDINMKSRGYNIPCSEIDDLVNNPRAVERGVDIKI